MRIAVIDCGTNTFHLLIADKKAAGKFEVLLRENIAVKLGETGITKRFISEIPFQRGINTLKNFSELIQKNKVDKVLAYATAALRNAENGNDFVEKTRQDTGIDLQLIDGQKEAELIYYGVRQAVKLAGENILITDIGGGSVEFIIANEHEIFWKKSFETGAALLLEKFNPSNPISPQEVVKIKNHLANEWSPLFDEIKNQQIKIAKLIGSSGSFDTFANMIDYQFHSVNISDSITEYDLSIQEYKIIYEQLLHSTTEERTRMKGLIAMRVDMIVIASILLTFVLENTGIDKLTLSTYALKEGILYSVG